MGIIANIKKSMVPPEPPGPKWTPEMLEGAVQVEQYITWREARARMLLLVVAPMFAVAGVSNDPLWLPMLLLLSTVISEPNNVKFLLRRFHVWLRTPWLWWWSSALTAFVLFGLWIGFVPFKPTFNLVSIVNGGLGLVMTAYVYFLLKNSTRMEMCLNLFKSLGVHRAAKEMN